MSALLERIHSRCLADGDCLLWQGPANTDGTPCVYIEGKRYRGRRTVYEEANGAAPNKKQFLVVLCDHDACLEPLHLKAATRREQMRLASQRGKLHIPARTIKQQQLKRTPEFAKLTDDRVKEIHARRSAGLPLLPLAKEWGVHHSILYRVAAGTAWRTLQAGASIFNL